MFVETCDVGATYPQLIVLTLSTMSSRGICLDSIFLSERYNSYALSKESSIDSSGFLILLGRGSSKEMSSFAAVV